MIILSDGGFMSTDFDAPSNNNSHLTDTGHRLSYYTTAALATGVGLLSLVQPAASEVVVTHKTIPIAPYYAGGSPVPIDLNNDGIADVSFGFTSFGPYSVRTAVLSLINRPENAVITQGEGPRFPLVSALSRGGKVGPSDQFNANVNAVIQESSEVGHYPAACTGQNAYGHWGGNNPDRFVGVKFQIENQTHYGWVRLNVHHSLESKGCRRITATITAYAYETVPNRAITIGNSASDTQQSENVPTSSKMDHPSLGALALGAPGIEIWRRD
jgi:hypothetical protein